MGKMEKKVSTGTGSGNGLDLTGQKYTTWTNVDYVLWHHLVTLGYDGVEKEFFSVFA